MLLRVAVKVTSAAIVLAAASGVRTEPSCTLSIPDVCNIIAKPEFVDSYRSAFAVTDDPADAVEDLRYNMRRAITGAGHAGPAAVGKLVNQVLDDALKRAQLSICPSAAEETLAMSELAAGLFEAANKHGARLSPKMLGAMTGTVIGITRHRGLVCLCRATEFRGIEATCAR